MTLLPCVLCFLFLYAPSLFLGMITLEVKKVVLAQQLLDHFPASRVVVSCEQGLIRQTKQVLEAWLQPLLPGSPVMSAR